MGRIVVGTSSWADPGFVEEWYPPGLPARDRLAFYAERFEGVEVNATFYAVPRRSVVERWVEQTPDGFTFDVKLHRLLSRHSAGPETLPAALRETATANARGRVVLDAALESALAAETLAALEPLATAGRLSSFLLQLSPSFRPKDHDLGELAHLVEVLAPHRVAVELRHRGWLDSPGRTEETLGRLEAMGAAFVCVDVPTGPAPTLVPMVDAVTRADLAYVRAHGRNAEGWMRGRSVAERFGYDYGDDELQEIAGRVRDLAAQAEDVRMQFNNNRGGDAPQAAHRFRELLGQDAGPPVPQRSAAGAGRG